MLCLCVQLIVATFAPLMHCLRSTNKSVAAHATLLLAALASRSAAHAAKLLSHAEAMPLVLQSLQSPSDMVVAKAAVEVLVSICAHRSCKPLILSSTSSSATSAASAPPSAIASATATASAGAGAGVLQALVDALALAPTRHPAVNGIHYSALLCVRCLVSGNEVSEQLPIATAFVMDRVCV